MALISWTDDLSVNIKTIDDQHKKLVGMINEFYDKIGDKSNHELISDLIKRMKEYTIVHFNTEERLFKKYNYQDFDHHKRQHDDFVKKVVDLEERLNSGKMILSFEITSFLKEWLIKHIKGTDQKYAEFLIANGVV